VGLGDRLHLGANGAQLLGLLHRPLLRRVDGRLCGVARGARSLERIGCTARIGCGCLELAGRPIALQDERGERGARLIMLASKLVAPRGVASALLRCARRCSDAVAVARAHCGEGLLGLEQLAVGGREAGHG
jgi:hypothetical protein